MLKRTSKELFLIADLGSDASFDNPEIHRNNVVKQKDVSVFEKYTTLQYAKETRFLSVQLTQLLQAIM